MYRKKNREKQEEEVKISLEALVPEKHILRTIDKAIDFSFIYEEIEGLYSDKGRPGIDPVSLFKIVFIQYLFGIRSMRQTIKESKRGVSPVYRLLVDGAGTAFLYFREKLCQAICRNRHL